MKKTDKNVLQVTKNLPKSLTQISRSFSAVSFVSEDEKKSVKCLVVWKMNLAFHDAVSK